MHLADRKTIIGLGIGAAAAYFLDPDRGAGRRARLRDKSAKSARRFNRNMSGMAKDATHRGVGAVHEARYRYASGPVDDDVLHERVRSEMGPHVSHPHAVAVEANEGVITLTGDILAEEEAAVVKAVRHVPGVKDVHTRWQVHEGSLDGPVTSGR